MASFTLKVEGLQELDRRLREFGPKIVRNGLRAANFAGAKVMHKAAKEAFNSIAHPYATGHLLANIVTFRRRGPDNVAKHSIGIKGIRRKFANTSQNRRLRRVGKKYQADGPAFYAKFIEYGSSKMAAKPFLRPAFNANVEAAIEAVRQRLAKAVAVAAAKR